MRILVTGAAGFIGYHVCEYFLRGGAEVVGLDNLNDYYDVSLKQARLERLAHYDTFTFRKLDLADGAAVSALFREFSFTHVIHLAAQAGVRHSITHPEDYVRSNLDGFFFILEGCRHSADLEHLVFASSSSVYGLNTLMPYSVHHNVDHPISLYAASKKSNELMAHTYSYLYGIPATGLRFFTVYGPWGRPDMAIFLFTDKTIRGEPIDVFNHGQMRRDFTYIDDIVEGVARVTKKPAAPNPEWSGHHPDPSSSPAPFRVFNIGNNNSVTLEDFIATIEEALGMQAFKNYLPLQPGDVPETYADIDDLYAHVGFRPHTDLTVGVANFVSWFREYYGI